MPPVGPQGSRGGLITAVVIFTIGFVASTIFAIYYAVALNKKTDQFDTLQKKTSLYYGDTSSPAVQALLEMRQNPNVHDPTVLGAAVQTMQDLGTQIIGHERASAAATQPTMPIDEAHRALDQANSVLNGSNSGASPDNLVDAIDRLIAYAAEEQREATNLSKSSSDAAAKAAAQIKNAQDMTEKAKADVAAASAEKQKTMDELQATHQKYEKMMAAEAADRDRDIQNFNVSLRKQEASGALKDQRIAALSQDKAALEEKLSGRRVNTIEPLIRQPDGSISSVASEDVVYINLGAGDHITPGMTFEVYSQRDGIPQLGDGMSSDNMPAGEGSIEIQQVGAASSQCRVTKLEAGQHIYEGDPIVNLVYDRNTRYNFFVYGQYDLAQLNRPNNADRDKIKSLVTQWGGSIQDKINADTDFVIMGSVPIVHDYTADDLQDPYNVKQKADEEAALKAYNDILTQAIELHIPVMNQNRFLYFCGYYDNAQR